MKKRMEKLVTILIATGIISMMSACGNEQTITNSSSSSDNTEVSSESVELNSASSDIEEEAEENTDESLIEFENVILVDDDTITLELVNFYAEDYNWTDRGLQNEKHFTVKATNNSDHKITLNPGKIYLNDEECFVSLVQGTITPDPGKSGVYSFLVGHQTTPNPSPLESIDDLYLIEGRFEGLNVYEDSSKNTRLEVEFSIPKALNGDSSSTSEESDTEI